MQQPHNTPEALFLADAQAMKAASQATLATLAPIRPVIAPAIAVQAAALRRKRKQRRELLLMLAIGLPVLTAMGLAGLALLRGEGELMKLLLIPCGICGLLALVTLPLIEKFREDTGHAPRQPGAMPVR